MNKNTLSDKTGVLIVNLGTPDAPSRGAVYRYLRQFLTDPRVIDYPWLARQLLVQGIIAPIRSGSSAKLYKKLWLEEGSPLKVYGERVAEGLQNILGENYHVELAMRYQNPSIGYAVNKLFESKVSEIVVFPMFPQYASATTGSVHDEVMRVLRTKQIIPNVRFINSYHDFEPMIDIFVENAQKHDLNSFDHILFSYHGLPQRQLKRADDFNYCLCKENCCQSLSEVNQFCYSAQCHATSYAIADKLGLSKDQYSICFQSRLGPEKWAQPYTSKIIEERAEKGDKRLLVFCPAFVSDCLETTIEISDEYQELFEEKGGEEVVLVESLNDHPKWISGIKELIVN